MTSAEKFVYKAVPGPAKTDVDVDLVAAEIVRNSLNSAANHMKQALVRTAFSPIIYDVLDFAVAIYDRNLRLLSQAPSLPLFMGTMNFCVGAAVEAAGGEEALDPGDILLVTDPYMTGSHPQDAAVVMPVFMDDGELIGYTTIKGHWLDIGGKEPYSTDTVDVFQEGTVYPGIKLYRRGEEPVAFEDKLGEIVGGHGWAGAVVDFLDVLEGKMPNPIPARFGAKTVAVCEAALASMASGKPQRPEEF